MHVLARRRRHPNAARASRLNRPDIPWPMRSRFRAMVTMALPALALLAATCVGETRQRGPTGPWVGEVTNFDNVEARDVTVNAHLFDADGNELAHGIVPTCPYVLLPGEHGTFEYFYDGFGAPSPKLPLSVRFAVGYVRYGKDFKTDGLTVREIRRDVARRFALVELRNNSPMPYYAVEVCANLRSAGGVLMEVGHATPLPSTLQPGDTRTFPIFFNSMPDGVLDVHAGGASGCCPIVKALDPGLFHVTATKLIDDGERRVLRVVGEWHNPTGQALGSAVATAEIAGSPADRIDATNVGCGDESVGGDVGPDGSAAAEFDISVDRSVPRPMTPVITGLQATEKSPMAPPTVEVTANASSVTPTTVDGETWLRVTATLRNSTDQWLHVGGECFNVRDGGGRLVGTTSSIDRPWIAPHSSTVMSALVQPLAYGVSGDVVALAIAFTSAP